MFFKHAGLLRFGRGVLNTRQPFVELTKSTLNGFCDGSKDFLKLSRLLSHKHSIDHSQNAQECLSRVHAIRGAFGGPQGKENSGSLHDVPLDPKHVMLIWDTGASYGLTPFRSDFIDYVACTIPVRDVTRVNNVIGIGTTLHKFSDTKGNPVYLPCVSYHLPQTDVRLFSPQTYHQMHGGYSEVYGNCIKMLLNTSEIQIPIVREKHNLPVVFDSYVSPKVKKTLASSMRSGLCHTRLNALDFFQDTSVEDRRICAPLSHIGPEHYNRFCGPCVGANANENLSAPQKELLKWHWKLGISMYRIQEMMRERHYEEPNGNKTILPAIIKPKLVSARNCIVPPCQSCLLARGNVPRMFRGRVY